MDRLTARHADGWNAAWPNRAQALAPRIADIDAACRKVGRDPASLERSVGVMVDLPARGPSRRVRASLQPLAGSASESVAVIDQRGGIIVVESLLPPSILLAHR